MDLPTATWPLLSPGKPLSLTHPKPVQETYLPQMGRRARTLRRPGPQSLPLPPHKSCCWGSLSAAGGGGKEDEDEDTDEHHCCGIFLNMNYGPGATSLFLDTVLPNPCIDALPHTSVMLTV